MTPQQLSELGLIVDRACDLGDEQELLIIIAINSEYVETLNGSIEKATLYYFLANAWSGLRTIRHYKDKSSIWNYEQDEINHEIIYLRKAKKEKSFLELPVEYQCSILTNLANIFSHAGRTVYALRLYTQALKIEKNFFMARANRGLCYLSYLRLDYDESHKIFFAKLAYDDLIQASKYIDLYIKNGIHVEYHSDLKAQFNAEIQGIEAHVQKDFLLTNLELDKFSFGKLQEEQDYRRWGLSNCLFLSSMNDIGNHSIAVHDPLNLPNLFSDIDSGFQKYITYFNQMKQEYITYRHLLYEGIREKTNKLYDQNTALTDDYDYNLYDIDTEKIKLAFRGFYSIFDKIAYFLNEYFDLPHGEKIDFRTVWKDSSNYKKLNPKFDGLSNLALRGLYFISKDLFSPKDNKSFITVVEPESEKINDIRNHLEHKFINIKLIDVSEYQIEDKREQSKQITRDELENKTLHLARLVREAMLYLSFTVHIEEDNNRSTHGKYMSIVLETLRSR
ncbi:MAG: LA2681 family HEPN domain-containing protein [Sulfuricurvum sp.]|uniref:LA2681 family HEPN domain-containing protein n=1 Tax=Sulfuricurvum sp. TaxID=2025608 RepID=UPI0026089291|nr:LA2681 family HEPN domain-containing protein [Sulfuricurvum sp.]MDD2949248.1 LA2681 family HEPN domain-containing protein [Sulfuricurvum sp.]MDD5119184.1 LA2681 family HEPN domain-containing protein [Sulfuricurvum sp.]